MNDTTDDRNRSRRPRGQGKVKCWAGVEEVLLPNWGEEECPWCWEHQALRDYLGTGPKLELSQRLLERYELLDRDEESGQFPGITRGAFWSTDGDQLTLGGGSIFGPSSMNDAELFFSVASAVQTLRSRGELDEEHRPPLSKLLTHEFWARGRFYAPAITAAILRAARSHDLLQPQPQRNLLKLIDDRLLEEASRTVRWELLLGVAQGKLPLTGAAGTVTASDADDDVVGDFLAKLIESRWGQGVTWSRQQVAVGLIDRIEPVKANSNISTVKRKTDS